MLSVVIAVRNGGRTLPDQLASLARQDFDRPREVVAADNGSTDDTIAAATKFDRRLPGLRVVDASARAGQAYALNVGAVSVFLLGYRVGLVKASIRERVRYL